MIGFSVLVLFHLICIFFFLSLLFFCCGSVSPSTDFGMLILEHASDLLFVIDPLVNLT